MIPSEVENSQTSVRSDDVPLSEFSLLEKEFENTFGHSQSYSDISRSDSKDSDKLFRRSQSDTSILNKSLGPDTSFKFAEVTITSLHSNYSHDLNSRHVRVEVIIITVVI